MKAFSFLTVFLLAGLFLVSFVDYAKAGVGPHGECVNSCKVVCDAAQYKESCAEFTGEERKDCNTFINIISGCCYHDCLEENCGVEDAPGESIVCEILEQSC